MKTETKSGLKITYKKGNIPNALRQQVWLKHCGEVYKRKCLTSWCDNSITVFNFHCGHNIPEVRGGKTTIKNLIPICTQCNLSMGHQYTFDEWCRNFKGHGGESAPYTVATVGSTGWSCCRWFR